MYYTKIYGIWVCDQYDYFLLSMAFGSIIASQLRKYLSEEKANESLKN